MDLKQVLKDFNQQHGVYATFDGGPNLKQDKIIMCRCNDWVTRTFEGNVDITALLEEMYKQLGDKVVDG